MSFIQKFFAKGKGKTSDNSTPMPFENISSSIFPYFKQFLPDIGISYPLPSDLREVDKTKTYDLPGIEMIFSNVCDDLNCLYALDTGHSFEIILDRHLKEWNIDREKLHALALENFRSLIVQKLRAQGDTNGIMFIIDGNLEASLVLIDEIWAQLQDQIGEPVVIAVPSRDVLLATGSSNRVMIDQYRENAKEILRTAEYRLSRNLFIREGEKWKVFERILE